MLSRAHVPACQSLAHHTTPMGRCRKSVDNWAPPCEGQQPRQTSRVPPPTAQQECATNVHVSRVVCDSKRACRVTACASAIVQSKC
eukprot:scaffold17290_cov157-Isochrysis_galbana.AAC.3